MSNGIYRVQTVRTTVSQIFNPLRRPSARCLIVAARARQTIFLASRRAGARVGKMHREEILVGPALLRFPVGPAVLRRQDCPAVRDHPAGARVGKINTCENFIVSRTCSPHEKNRCFPESARARPITCKASVAIVSVRNARGKPSTSIASDGARERTGQ
jgi:hypothetical protein